MIRQLVLAGVVASAIGMAHPALAQTAPTATLAVSWTVVDSCTVTGSTLSFEVGSQALGLPTGQAVIQVDCAEDVAFKVALDGGWNSGGKHSRAMVHDITNTDFVDYELYKDSGRTTVWGDSDFANTYSGGSSASFTGSGSAQSITIFAAVTSAAGVPSGPYVDEVKITVHY